MAYIPQKHLKYDVLPRCRKNGGEVIVYDSKTYDAIHDKGCDLSFPYNIRSYEEYYDEIDRCIARYPQLKKLLKEYKENLLEWNNKDVWGIVKYHGESNDSFTKERCYYVPIGEKEGKLIPNSGIIDDEEWTSYEAWSFSKRAPRTTDTESGFIVHDTIKFERPRFEIILDPSGRLKQYFPGNENRIFIEFIYHSEKNTLIGISEEIPRNWQGRRVIIEGQEYETTPVYDLPNHIAIVGNVGELGQEIIFI